MKRPLEFFAGFVRLLSAISGIFVLTIIVIIIIDILGRAIFNAPLPGSTTASTALLVCLIFLSLADVQRKKEHYRVDLVADLMPPGLRKAVDLLAHVISLSVILLLAKYSAAQAIVSFEKGEVGYDLFAFPIWPARIVLAAGLIILALQIVIDIVQDVRKILGSSAP